MTASEDDLPRRLYLPAHSSHSELDADSRKSVATGHEPRRPGRPRLGGRARLAEELAGSWQTAELCAAGQVRTLAPTGAVALGVKDILRLRFRTRSAPTRADLDLRHDPEKQPSTPCSPSPPKSTVRPECTPPPPRHACPAVLPEK